ncbi:glycosyltransferase family 2 protein [Halalkalicoccus sp. NIPERK01]|uniref:glycosyltransferase family 2 protein n=1 Tax=Halalkalicoccus sp. NIPERK01 TaxID=3053469 RepID=UPI00256ED752|nr:glycosyltransferase family 2 protein [Halalkalicoccus sp. NIPERK01]MDL5363302.1 glycosyltransferase family 2 protein [Halalkalicoccus sp. NIPERK01]
MQTAIGEDVRGGARIRVDPSATSAPQIDAELVRPERVSYRPASADAQRPMVVVGIPAHNEAGSIASVIGATREHADAVFVVDDGSRDGTATEARRAGATVVEHEYNRGYGTALGTLFRAAEREGATHLVVLDADGRHDSRDIPRLLSKQRETDADIVIGSRFVDGATTGFPPYRRVGLAAINALTNLSMGRLRPGARIADTQSGFRAYNRRAIAGLAGDETIGTRMGASTDILYHAHERGYAIEEVGISVRYDVENATSIDPLAHGYGLVSDIARTVQRSHPLLSLGAPGLLGALLGVTMAYWLVSGFLSTGAVSYGLFVASALLLTGGVLAATAAVVLYTLGLSREV